MIGCLDEWRPHAVIKENNDMIIYRLITLLMRLNVRDVIEHVNDDDDIHDYGAVYGGFENAVNCFCRCLHNGNTTMMMKKTTATMMMVVVVVIW